MSESIAVAPAAAISSVTGDALYETGFRQPHRTRNTTSPPLRRTLPAMQVAPALRLVKNLGYGERGTGNALIHGDNLPVLKSLRSEFADRVRCVYIDPPYNNQERYRHYDDNRSHTEWLEMISERLEAIRPLLTLDGSLWISVDDREVCYLKVAADSIFGRQNFVTTVVWQQRTTRENRRVFSNNHEYLLVYARDFSAFRMNRNPLPSGPELLARYKNPDSDPRGPWQSVSAHAQDGHATPSQYYDIVAPNGRVHRPPPGRCWVYTLPRMKREIAAGNIWFGRDGNGVPRIKRFLAGSSLGLTPETLWLAKDVGTNDDAKKQLLRLLPDLSLFETPKPEPLIARVLDIATNESDLVLDAFLGSGTTTAVAHKMRRQYIGIDCGDHIVTHTATRMRKVVDGDASGISGAVRWGGGSGFDFYRGPL